MDVFKIDLLSVERVFGLLDRSCNSKECTGEDPSIAYCLRESIKVYGCSAKSVVVFPTSSL